MSRRGWNGFSAALAAPSTARRKPWARFFDKARFWDRIKDVKLNDRQRLVINRLLDGFEGKLTTSKYATLAKCSQDTAYRDILDLIEHHVLAQNPEGGRSTSYSLARENGV